MTFATLSLGTPCFLRMAILAGPALFGSLTLTAQPAPPPQVVVPAPAGTPEVQAPKVKAPETGKAQEKATPPKAKQAKGKKDEGKKESAAGTKGEKQGKDPQGKVPAAEGKTQEDQAGKTEPKQGGAQNPIDPAELLAPFDSEGLLGRLRSAVGIEHLEEDALVNSLLPYLTGERKQLVLEVRTLIGALSDVRFRVREDAEKSLLNLGPRVRPILEEIAVKELPFEAQVRLEHVKKALSAMGDEDIQRRARMARGLAECLEYRPGQLEAGALLQALDHIDPNVRLAAIRSLGEQLRDPDRARHAGDAFRKRTMAELGQLNLERRNATLTALGTMPLPSSNELLMQNLGDDKKPTSLRLLALRILVTRNGADKKSEIAAACTGRDSALLKSALDYLLAPPATPTPGKKSEMPQGKTPAGEEVASKAEPEPEPADPAQLRITLKDQGSLSTSILGTLGEKVRLVAPEEYGDLDELRIPRGRIDRIDNPDALPRRAPGQYLVLMKTGTRLCVDKLAFDGKKLRGEALGRSIELDRSQLRSIFPANARLRAYGGSRLHDQLRLTGNEGKPIEGDILTMGGGTFKIQTKEGPKEFKREQLSSILFKVDRSTNRDIVIGDLNQYVQIDLADKQRLVGYLLDLEGDHIGLASRNIGCLALPLADTKTIQLSNSGQALTGFRLIVNYEESKVVEIDGEGRVVWELEELFYPADAELLVNGNVLITEQADGAVREYDRKGDVVWEYTDLQRPRSASKLPNGNVLIADPTANRVVEVGPDKKLVWEYTKKQAGKAVFRPYDVERLTNGNTLIVDFDDSKGSRVFEVSPDNRIVWEYKGTFLDADRLPNGNTLVCRSTGKGKSFECLEITPNKQIAWRITTKDYPYDVDRLPDGNTIVAEEGGVRIYNREGKMIKTVYKAWSYEVNSY